MKFHSALSPFQANSSTELRQELRPRCLLSVQQENNVATHGRNFVLGVKGKVVQKIETGTEEDEVYIDIHFQDETSCVIYVGPAQIKVESAPVMGWKNGDSHVIRKLL